MKALRKLEPEARGAYTGAMGWIEPGGDASFNVLIRTLQLSNSSTTARLGLGSGLVADSQPADEWVECLSKGAFVTAANPPIDLIETMRDADGAGLAAPQVFAAAPRIDIRPPRWGDASGVRGAAWLWPEAGLANRPT